jgi:hypothetical protein
MRTQEPDLIARAFPYAVSLDAIKVATSENFSAKADFEFDRMSARPVRNRAMVRMTCIDRAIINIYFHEGACAARTVRARGHGVHHQLFSQWLPGWRLPRKLRLETLPAELERKLSAIGPYYKRVRVNCDVLLIEDATRRVVDAMHNVYAAEVQGAPRREPACRAAA